MPHAGAGASTYQAWPALVPLSVEVFALQLPGREERLKEAPFTEWNAMIESVKMAIDTLPRTPIIFFGHSLGAIIALEAARYVALATPARLRQVFCAGRPWPGDGDEWRTDIADMADGVFLEMMADRYGSTGAALESDTIRDIALPILRADVALLMSYQWRPMTPLPCPITVFTGTSDPSTDGRDISLWQKETKSNFTHSEIEGDHLFHTTRKEELIKQICRHLDISSP